MLERSKLVTIYFLVFFGSAAQEIDIENFIEQNFDWQDQALPYEDIYESLYHLYTRPLNLNKATKEELYSLYLLRPRQIDALLAHRESKGNFVSIFELQSIPHFDGHLIRKILPFVTVETQLSTGKTLKEKIREAPNSFLLIRNTRRIETLDAYRTMSYLGDKNHLYTRFRISNPNEFSTGFTLEKDPGEKIIWNDKTKGLDHTSFHFQVQNKGLIDNLIIGDYQLQFGQGLVFGAGFAPGKGAETILTTRRGNTGLKPFVSVIEAGFFRGGATTMGLGSHELTFMGSRIGQDGNRKSDDSYSDFDEFVNSIQSTGLHRTKNELNSKNSVIEQNLGFNWLYQRTKAVQIGASILYSIFDLPIQPKPNNYNQFEFSGTSNLIGSGYFNFNWQNMLAFGELAISKSKGTGVVTGIILTTTSQLDVALIARNYKPDFHSFYGNAFSEGSRIINEKGLYWGLSFTPNRYHRINAYYDQFTFPWLKYKVNAPSTGQEWLFRYAFKPDKTSRVFFQLRNEQKQESQTIEGQNLSQLTDRIKWQYLINYDAQINNWLSLKTRIQRSHVRRSQEKNSGIVILQDFIFQNNAFRFSTRFALFDTEDFENRHYVFERNVLYAFSLPAYSGSGIRQYLLAEYKLTDRTTLYARYARFDLRNTESTGRGVDRTLTTTRSEWNAQLRIRI